MPRRKLSRRRRRSKKGSLSFSAGSPASKHFAGGKILKSAEFISDDLRPMRGPRRAHSGLWGGCPPVAQEKAIAEAKALQAAEEK